VRIVALVFFESQEGIVDKSDDERKGRRKVHQSAFRTMWPRSLS